MAAELPQNPGDRAYGHGDEVTLDVDSSVGDFDAGTWLLVGENRNVTGLAALDGTEDKDKLVVAKQGATGDETVTGIFRGMVRADDFADAASRQYPAMDTYGDGSALFRLQ